MHSPLADKDVGRFTTALRDQISSGGTDFSGFAFPPGFDFTQCELRAATHPLGVIDFTAAVFMGEARFNAVAFASKAVFHQVEFVLTADFNNASFPFGVSFEQVGFNHDALFQACRFGGEPGSGTLTRFVAVTFRRNASFSLATFQEHVVFSSCKFHNLFAFDNAAFAGPSTLQDIVIERTAGLQVELAPLSPAAAWPTMPFETAATLNGAHIGSRFVVARAKFGTGAPVDLVDLVLAPSAQIELREVDTDDNIAFDRLRGGDSVLIERCRFKGDASYRSSAFPRTVFDRVEFDQRAHFDDSDLQHVQFRSMKMRGVMLRGAHGVDKAEFVGIDGWDDWQAGRSKAIFPFFTKLTHCLYIKRPVVSDEVDVRSGSVPWHDRLVGLRSVERLYRALRASYEARNDHPRVNDFYFGEMEMRRIASSPHWVRRNFATLDGLYGMTSAYGTSWSRALVIFILLWLASTIGFLTMGVWIKHVGISAEGISQTYLSYVGVRPAEVGTFLASWPVLQRMIADAALHSLLVATFFARDAYGVPASMGGQILQLVESSVGPVILGLGAVALQRRYKR